MPAEGLVHERGRLVVVGVRAARRLLDDLVDQLHRQQVGGGDS